MIKWMPGHEKPAAPGVYRRRYMEANAELAFGPDDWFTLWDGEVWRIAAKRSKEAARSKELHPGLMSEHQSLPWRKWKGVSP